MTAIASRPTLDRGSQLAEPGTDPSSRRPAAHLARRSATIATFTGGSIAPLLAPFASVLLALAAAPHTQSRSRTHDHPTSP